MENVYGQVLTNIKEDLVKLSRRYKSSYNGKEKIETMRLMKDALDLIYRYDDKSLSKLCPSGEFYLGGNSVDYFDILQTLYNNGDDKCIISSSCVGDDLNYGTCVSYRFASNNGGVLVLDSVEQYEEIKQLCYNPDICTLPEMILIEDVVSDIMTIEDKDKFNKCESDKKLLCICELCQCEDKIPELSKKYKIYGFQ